METSNSFQQAIQAYLENRAKEDELFAKSYAKPNKSVKECCNYILGQAKKRGNAVAISDAEVFGMAVHYYDEDDIKISKLPVNVKSSVSAPVQQAQNPDPIKKVAATKKQKPIKREEDPRQMSLF